MTVPDAPALFVYTGSMRLGFRSLLTHLQKGEFDSAAHKSFELVVKVLDGIVS